MVCSTAAKSSMKVIRACYTPTSLQYLCCVRLRQMLPCCSDIPNVLALPPGLHSLLNAQLGWVFTLCSSPAETPKDLPEDCREEMSLPSSPSPSPTPSPESTLSACASPSPCTSPLPDIVPYHCPCQTSPQTQPCSCHCPPTPPSSDYDSCCSEPEDYQCKRCRWVWLSSQSVFVHVSGTQLFYHCHQCLLLEIMEKTAISSYIWYFIINFWVGCSSCFSTNFVSFKQPCKKCGEKGASIECGRLWMQLRFYSDVWVLLILAYFYHGANKSHLYCSNFLKICWSLSLEGLIFVRLDSEKKKKKPYLWKGTFVILRDRLQGKGVAFSYNGNDCLYVLCNRLEY